MSKLSFSSAAFLVLFAGCDLSTDVDLVDDPQGESDDDVDVDDSRPDTSRDAIDASLTGYEPPEAQGSDCAVFHSAGAMNLSMSSSATLESFEATAATPGSTCVTGPLSEATSSKCAQPGDVASGFVIQDDANETSLYGAGWMEGIDGTAVGPADIDRVLEIDILGDHGKVGFMLHADAPGFAEVRFYDGLDRTLSVGQIRFGTLLGGASDGVFRGLSCSGAVARVEVEPLGSNMMLLVDDLTFD